MNFLYENVTGCNTNGFDCVAERSSPFGRSGSPTSSTSSSTQVQASGSLGQRALTSDIPPKLRHLQNIFFAGVK